MESHIDSCAVDAEATWAEIDPKVAAFLGSLTEKEIRTIALGNKIEPHTRAGNKKALLAELSRALWEKKRRKKK